MEGVWITTFTGKQISVTDPKPHDIDLTDIAYGLRQIRFGAQTPELMTIAQHSMHVYWLTSNSLEGLMHDAHEAYVGDLKGPIKWQCPDFQKIEDAWDNAIRARFGLPRSMSRHVHEADKQARLAEGRFLGMTDVENWGLPELRQGQVLEICDTWEPDHACQYWLSTARRLTGG